MIAIPYNSVTFACVSVGDVFVVFLFSITGPARRRMSHEGYTV